MVPHFTYITSAFLTFKGEKFSINCAVLLIKNRNDIFCQYLCTFSRRVLHPKCLRHSSYGHYGLVLQENAFPEFSPCGSCILYQLPFAQYENWKFIEFMKFEKIMKIWNKKIFFEYFYVKRHTVRGYCVFEYFIQTNALCAQ